MIRFSPYITIYNLKKEFNALDEIIWTFSKNLKGISTVRHRFNIHLVDHKDYERLSIEGSIKSIWKYFDESKLEKITLLKQKEILLGLITESFLSVSKELGWDKSSILEAKEKSLEEGIEFKFLSKPKYNKSRSKSCSLRLILIENKVSIYAILKEKNKTDITEILMLNTFSHYISWFNIFKNNKWINEDDFGFIFSNGITLTCSFSNQKVKFNHSDKEENNGFIRSITYRKFSSKKERIEWINK